MRSTRVAILLFPGFVLAVLLLLTWTPAGYPSATALPGGTTFHLDHATSVGSYSFVLNVTVPTSSATLSFGARNASVDLTDYHLVGTVESNASIWVVISGNGGYWTSLAQVPGQPFQLGPVTGTGGYFHPLNSGVYTVTFLSRTAGAAVYVLSSIGVVPR